MRVRWRPWIATALAAALVLSLATSGIGTAAQTRPAPQTKAAPAKSKPGAPTPAPPPPGAGLETEARHAFIIEAETGTVLFSKRAEERMPPASMSKIMTAYVIFGMLKEGRIKLTDDFPVSQTAWK